MNRQGIEGVPDHLKIVAVDSSCDYPTYAADNVYNVYNLADVKIPEGYEFSEFRTVNEGDHFVNVVGNLDTVRFGFIHTFGPDYRRIIVKPVAKKTRRVLVVEDETLHFPWSTITDVRMTWTDGSTNALRFSVVEQDID